MSKKLYGKHVDFGGIIRRLRKEMGLTLKDLSVDLCNEGTLSKIERGLEFPHEELIDQIAERLGEENFYERYLMNDKYERFCEKRNIKQAIITAAEAGAVDLIETNLSKYKEFIGECSGEDMQFYLALQNIWYRMNGVKIKNHSKKFIEIFEMKNKFPEATEDVKEVAKRIRMRALDYLIVNNIGLELMSEHKEKLAVKVFHGLYLSIHDNTEDGPLKKKRLAIVSSNCAIACIKAGWLEAARKYWEYAYSYCVKTTNLKLIVSAIIIEAELLDREGNVEEAQEKRRYIDCIEHYMFSGVTNRSRCATKQYLSNGIAIL